MILKRCIHKFGLDFIPTKQEVVSTNFRKPPNTSLLNKRGNKINEYYFKKVGVLEGKHTWIPEGRQIATKSRQIATKSKGLKFVLVI